jgi:integrase/recombinase XerD
MGETTLRQACTEYVQVHLAARNYATRTRVEYAHDVEELTAFLLGAGVSWVGEIKLALLERFLAQLDCLGLSGATRRRKTIVFRAFLGYLHRLGHLPSDLSRRLVVPFAGVVTPRVLTQTEYQRLLAACSGHARDLAMVTLLLQTGLRLSELTGLLLSDLQLPISISIRGTNSRSGRTIPLNTKACETLQSYISKRPATDSSNIFLNERGTALGSRGVEKILAGYLVQTGILEASVHSLRHTFATHHVARGTSLKTVQQILGLADIRSVELYFPLAQDLKRQELEDHAL